MSSAEVAWPLHAPFAGITQRHDAGFNLDFEASVQALAEAALFTQQHKQLADLERMVLTRRVKLARSQIAHFWYLAAEAYMARLLWQDADEVIELCLRALDPTNLVAQAQVHTLRYRVAFQRQHFKQARESCQIVLNAIQMLQPFTDCTIASYDILGLLAAAKHMATQVQFRAQG